MKLSIIFLCLLMFSCGSDETTKTNKSILTEDEMISLLVEVHLADAIAINEKIEEAKLLNLVKKKYLISILNKNNISIDQFENSLEFYQKQPEVLFYMYEKIMVELSSREAANNGEEVEESEEKKK